MTQRNAIRIVALFEALKGLVVLAGASGLLIIHSHTLDIATRLIEHAHLDPDAKYPHIFLDAAQHFQDTHLLLLALITAAYCTLRFAEAYGLFYEKAWAEILAAASGAVYVPFELTEALRHPHPLHITVLVLNIIVVLLMLHALWQRRLKRA